MGVVAPSVAVSRPDVFGAVGRVGRALAIMAALVMEVGFPPFG